MNKLLISLLLFTSFATQASWFESDEVKTMKGAQLNACPEVTIEQMVDSFISNPSWDSGHAEGNTYVNIVGGISFKDKPIEVLIQFRIFDDNSLDLNAVEFNEIPQAQWISMGLINAMCDSAKKAYSTSQQAAPVQSDRVLARVFAIDFEGEETLKLSTDKGDFKMNFFALSEQQVELVKSAATLDSMLCFIGSDAVIKDDIREKCD